MNEIEDTPFYVQTVFPGSQISSRPRVGHGDSRQMVWLKDTTCFNPYIFGEKPLSGSCRASLVCSLSCALSPLLHSDP